MSKVTLKDVTLVCATDVEVDKAFEIMQFQCQNISFGDVKLLSSNKINNNVTEIDPITSLEDYDNFIFNNLNNHVKTEFCMIMQTDGYPINFNAWQDEFLQTDYIGAPWLYDLSIPLEKAVGNSGFSIRSKRMMEQLSKYKYDSHEDGGEDAFICRTIDEELKSRGCKFASIPVARAFSVENTMYNGQFGFHGAVTMKMNKDLGIFSF